MTETERNLRAIEHYIALGLRVFPVNPETKRPHVQHGFYDATLNLSLIREWWKQWPGAAIAIPTGHVSGFFSYDIDPRNGGLQSHAMLVAEHGELPPTPTFRSGGGGKQMLFAYPSHKLPSRVGLKSGLDIKSDGGYIIVPFSKHKSGNFYEWESERNIEALPYAPAPEWFITLILESNRPGWDGKKESVCADELCFPEGTRENSLVSLIGSMNRRGMTRDAILAAMKVENEAKCRPPLSVAEVEAIVGRQLKQYQPDPDFAVGVPKDTFEPFGWPGRSSLEGVALPDAGLVEEIVTSLLGKGTVTIFAATWKTGKTLLMYRLILDTLRGNPVYGVFHTIRPLKVMMLQFEMPMVEDERRYRRLALGAGMEPQAVTEFASMGRLYHYSRPLINLADPKDTKNFHALIFGGGFDLVIMDSINAAFPDTDGNDNNVVKKLFADVLQPLTTNGVSVVMLHHKRKSGQRRKGDPPEDIKSAMLGAQAWGSSADRVFMLDPVVDPTAHEPGSFKVKLTLAGSWAPGNFEHVILQIHDDGDGTCIEAVSDEFLKSLNHNERVAQDSYSYIRDHGEVPWKILQAHLKDEGFSRSESCKGRDLAVQRGWIVPLAREKANEGLIYVSGVKSQ